MASILRVRDKNGNVIDIPAIQGDSAYKIAVKNGFEGTEEEWLESLKGGGAGLTEEQAANLAANTEARHTHKNKTALDTLTEKTIGNSTRLYYGDFDLAFKGEIPAAIPATHVRMLLNGSNPSLIENEYLTAEGFKILRDTLLSDYATKELVEALGSPLKIELVETLPETGEEGTIYLVPNGDAENNVYEEYLFVNDIAELIGSTQIDLSDYYTKEQTDEIFAKKADIPVDESYELIGQTPLTLENGGNIKLVANGETSYEMKTPTVWRFDKAEYTLENCSIDTSKGYYEVAITKPDITGFSQAYISFLITGLEAGKEYTIYPNVDGLPYNPDEYKWHGQVTAWDGETSKATLLFSGHGLHSGTKSFIPSTDKVLLRFYVAKNITPYNEWIATFNSLYINYADASEKLTEIYNKSGVFLDVETFKAVPSGVVITTDPTASVYRKSSTDKTLTQSDVPADAEETGKQITEVKSFLPLYGKTIANFGDSIFGNARPPKDVSTFLAEKTGATVYNCAFGGCRMGVHTGHWDAFSMYRLADAIANNDYSLQDDALNYEDRVSYAETPLALIKSTDFSTIDIVTIGYGTNDFTGGNALDNEENPLDTTTLTGALRYSIETLLTAFPNLRIFILSATYRFWKDENNEYTEDSNTYLNKHNKTLLDYNAKLKEVAEEYNLPFIDNYNIGIGKFNRYQYFPVTDGTHHNETGRRLIAEHLAGALTSCVSDGKDGKDGYTPIKGIDYFNGEKGDKGDKGDPYTLTDADKETIVEAVIAALPVAEGVGF